MWGGLLIFIRQPGIDIKLFLGHILRIFRFKKFYSYVFKQIKVSYIYCFCSAQTYRMNRSVTSIFGWLIIWKVCRSVGWSEKITFQSSYRSISFILLSPPKYRKYFYPKSILDLKQYKDKTNNPYKNINLQHGKSNGFTSISSSFTSWILQTHDFKVLKKYLLFLALTLKNPYDRPFTSAAWCRIARSFLLSLNKEYHCHMLFVYNYAFYKFTSSSCTKICIHLNECVCASSLQSSFKKPAI